MAGLEPVRAGAGRTALQLSQLVDRAHAGEENILAKAGVPYARLVPLVTSAQRELGFLAGQVALGADFERESLRPLAGAKLRDGE